MRVVAALALLLVNVPFGRSCDEVDQVLFCQNIPSYFSHGYFTLVMFLSDIGEINSTMFRSTNLSSVTRLRIDNAGITGVADGAFSSFQNLTSVSLRRNALTQMNSKWFGRPSVLRELSLEENQMEAVKESTLEGLIGLSKLSLNKNRIRTIEPNSFRSQTVLAELDLSENRMTRVSPQVFSPLRSTRVRLDRNPWDCSCGAEDFVVFLKDLQSRSLLDRQMEVTCESPPPLRGQRVWNVTACVASPSPVMSPSPVTSPSPGPSSSTVHLRPTDALTTVPGSSAKVVTAPSQETSTVSSHTVTPPARPTPETSAMTQTATLVTMSPPSETETSTSTSTSTPPLTKTCATSEPDSHTVCMLLVVIVVLCVLLFVVCFPVVQHRRKRNNKTVMPGHQREEEGEVEDDSRSSPDQSPDPEVAQSRPFTGVRAQSADAVLFTSPFCLSGKHLVTEQHVAENTEAQTDGERKLEKTGGNQTENIANTTERRADANRSLDENPQCVSVSNDTVQYLSIGTNQSQTNPDHLSKQPPDSSGQRSRMGKVMGRISTWPPTAAQWQARCKVMEEEEDGNEKFPGEVKQTGNKQEHPSVSEQDKKEDEVGGNLTEDLTNKDPLRMNIAGMKSKCSEDQVHTDIKQEDPATVRHAGGKTQGLNLEKLDHDRVFGPAETPAQKSSGKARQGDVTRAGNRSTGSKARSDGTSPDDETLLRGNEYAFMDLLHEVVQNNGRWTRERWRQTHVNKPRR